MRYNKGMRVLFILWASLSIWAAWAGGEAVLPLRLLAVNGDVSGDGCVDDADLLAVLFAFGETGARAEDVNGDDRVDDADLLTVLFNFGAGC